MQLHTVTQPWHTIGIDIMGPFPPTPRQKRFLLVIVDYFTRWVELFALRQTTATHIANVLIDEVICRYGVPLHILSDNGPQFISHLFNEVCTALGITHKLTANYHPQTNMTERVNRTLKAQIAIYAQQHPGLWDKELQKLAFAIRTSVNETTGDTPAYLNLGRDPVLPLDLIINPPSPEPPAIVPERKFIQQYRSDLTHALRLTYQLVREQAEIQKLRQKTKYDRHTVNRQFLVGDLVWIQIPSPQIDNTSISHKLRPKYQGPCRLIEQLSPSSFNVIRLSDNVNLGATNVDRMKHYYEPQVATDLVAPPHDHPSPPQIRRYPLRNRRPPQTY
jgi:transposase InsO family protein